MAARYATRGHGHGVWALKLAWANSGNFLRLRPLAPSVSSVRASMALQWSAAV